MVSFELFQSTDNPPEKAASLLAAWHQFHAEGAAGGQARPSRGDFTPFVLKPWLGNLDIYDAEGGDTAETPTFRMRLNGSEVVAMTGENWTGKTAHDIDRRFGATLHDDFLKVYSSRLPLADHIRIFQKEYLTAYRVLLPVFSEAGDGRVVQIFLAVFPLR